MRGLTLLHRVRPCRFNNVRSRARAATAAARVVGYRQTSDTISFVIERSSNEVVATASMVFALLMRVKARKAAKRLNKRS
jgi:hypothetical protein